MPTATALFKRFSRDGTKGGIEGAEGQDRESAMQQGGESGQKKEGERPNPCPLLTDYPPTISHGRRRQATRSCLLCAEATLAIGESSVILPHLPLLLVGVSIWMKREGGA